jgi:hypothetical protein
MKTISGMMIAVALALAAGCGVAGGEGTTDTITITADDQSEGRRPLLDLTAAGQWIIDGTARRVDLSRIDVRSQGPVQTLTEWLARDGKLAPEQVLALSDRRIELSRSGAASTSGELGSHSLALSRCSDGLLCCEWVLNDCSEGPIGVCWSFECTIQ